MDIGFLAWDGMDLKKHYLAMYANRIFPHINKNGLSNLLKPFKKIKDGAEGGT